MKHRNRFYGFMKSCTKWLTKCFQGNENHQQAENVPPSSTTMLGYLTVECDGHTAHFDRDGVSFRLTLGCAVEAKFSKSEQTETNATLCFDDGVELSIDYAKGDENFEKYEFKWKSTNAYHYMKDVISTDSGGFWYGGPQLAQQRWPLMRNSNGFCPYVAGDVLKAESDPQSGMERYWLCSNKFAVFVADDIPLWTEHYEGRLSLQAQIRDSLYENFFPQTGAPVLSYTIFALKCGRNDSLKDFHMAVHRALYSGHQKFPDERIIREPIWTTWAKYKQDITQEKVLEFAKEIKDHNAPISQLELDDNWSTKYGDFEFDKAKFPNVKEMCAKLEVQGIRLTLWIHPYVNIDSQNAKDPRLRPFFVQTPCGKPVITKWWNGDGYIIDFTNPEAARWYENQLNKLREQGIFSFKFDSGEVTYLTRNFQLKNGKHPNDYVSAYVETAAKFGSAIEVRVFRRTQHLPIFVRTLDRQSTWDRIGLDSLLPVAFNFSIHGYHFNLPDMVGGNGYGETSDKELFIRWMQLNQFLLSIQFSYTPWEYDKETSGIFTEMMEVRRNLIDHLLDACKSSCFTGEPVICPMWFLSDSMDALSCSDQFIVNNRLIVAPVVQKGVTSRSVFLPEGTWKYALTQQNYIGPIKITISAPLIASVPYFIRVD